MLNEAQNLISPASLERKHEVSEKNVRNVLIVGGGAAFAVVLGMLVCGLLVHLFSQARPMQQMTPLGIIIAPNLQPLERFPKPNLQIDDDHAERVAIQEAQNEKLNGYGWVDRSNGVVRIPIGRATDLISQRGLPSRTNNVSQTDGTPLQLMQERAGQK